MTVAEKTARNFIKRYGKVKFADMIEAFEKDESSAEIGRRLGVSRERVRQWKDMFGKTVTIYLIHPEVARVKSY